MALDHTGNLPAAANIPEMERRRAATEATLARWRGKVFSWREGVTCVHLARAHLKNMGHRPPTLPRIRSPLGAQRALADRGWGSVGDMLDALLVRTPPAGMLLGDLAVVEGDAGLDAIMICAAPGKLVGFDVNIPALALCPVTMADLTGAWHV